MRTIVAFLLLAFVVGWSAIHGEKLWAALLYMMSGAALGEGDRAVLIGLAVLAIFAIIIKRR